MPARIALIVTLLLMAVPAASAASFDCADAATAFERAICSDPELSQADETLAVAYATALGGLSAAAEAAVRQDQREWLDYAERACTGNAKPRETVYDADGVACLGQLVDDRIRGLEASRMQAGRRFYPISDFAAFTDPEATGGEPWGTVTTKEFSSLRIDGDDMVAAAFNALVARRDARLREGSGEEFDPVASKSTDSSIAVRLEDIASRRISLGITDWWYGHGAAHGTFSIFHLHFLIEERRPLAAGDIFAGPAWEEALAGLVLEELERTIPGGIWPESEALVAEAATDPERWTFSEAGLGVQFQPYEVTAYAFGAPVAIVPWNALSPHLSDTGLEIATY